jgi:mannose-6-phosphate isomerase-like protein (cupin superfamily)
MTLLTRRAEGPWFPYAGQPMHILAGQDGLPRGFAAMEITVPAHFAGPIPHAHDTFDEAIYILSGRLLVVGDDEPQEAAPGSMFVAPRGQRHGFSNPSAEQALVLGIWAPAEPAVAFMRDIGAALMPDAPPDPDRMREIYARHASSLLPLSAPTTDTAYAA